MTKILRLNNGNFNKIVDRVALSIKSGHVCILPFDTVCGFVCSPKEDLALKETFDLKGRNYKKAIGLAVSDIETLKDITKLSVESESFIKQRVPGKYTFILSAKNDEISNFCQQNGTFGIRIPDNDLILEIAKAVGGTIAQTSANKSGRKNCFSVSEIMEQYSKIDLKNIDLIIDAGVIKSAGPSQIYDLTKEMPVRIERA